MKKYVAAASLGAVLLVAPAVVGLNSAAADYQTAIVTSTGTTVDPVLAEYGTQPTVSASVSSTVGTPTGTITITVRNSATNAVFATKTGAADESPVTYTFPATAPANATYRIESSFAATGAYQSSSAPAKNVTIVKATPTATYRVDAQNKNFDRISVTVTAPAGLPAPTGTVSVVHSGGSQTLTLVPGNGNTSTAQSSNIDAPVVVTSVSYSGDSRYAQAAATRSN